MATSMRRVPLRQVSENQSNIKSPPSVLAGPNKGTRGNKSVRKSIKVDKVANQLKAIELLESAQQYEQEGNLEEAVRYYEIAQDYLPTPSADLRLKIMNLKSTSDSKFRSSQKKMKLLADPHQQEIREIVNKNQKSLHEVSYSLDFGDEVSENSAPLPENFNENFEEEEKEQELEENDHDEVLPEEEPSFVLELEQEEEKEEDSEGEEHEERSEEELVQKHTEQEEMEAAVSVSGEDAEDDWSADVHGDGPSTDDEQDGGDNLEDFQTTSEVDETRLSSVSCVSSAPPPRDEVLSILQERTLQALEFQLFDRLNNGDYQELLQLKMIGPKRANYILQLREEYLEEAQQGEGDDESAATGGMGAGKGYFQSIDQLEDIGMKLKDCHTFLKKNVTLLAGLEQKNAK